MDLKFDFGSPQSAFIHMQWLTDQILGFKKAIKVHGQILALRLTKNKFSFGGP